MIYLLWGAVAVSVLAGGAYLLARVLNRRRLYRKRAALFHYGRRLTARVVGLEPDRKIGSACSMICRYFDDATGSEYTFLSDRIDWKGRVPHPGASVTVFVDPDSAFSSYQVDLSSLVPRPGMAI